MCRKRSRLFGRKLGNNLCKSSLFLCRFAVVQKRIHFEESVLEAEIPNLNTFRDSKRKNLGLCQDAKLDRIAQWHQAVLLPGGNCVLVSSIHVVAEILSFYA
jgi:hypothetical protein